MNQPVTVPEVMSADLPAGVFLLDVREDDEWTAGHAPEAVHVRLGDLGARLGELPGDRELYVICRSGNRSSTTSTGPSRPPTASRTSSGTSRACHSELSRCALLCRRGPGPSSPA